MACKNRSGSESLAMVRHVFAYWNNIDPVV
ncbi:Uncharacterised protein [Mycobacteroides abscessus subsp. abscessus]|nr:Uncharacterised protein [Mycobacteroides abscessus subsp. abscessus]